MSLERIRQLVADFRTAIGGATPDRGQKFGLSSELGRELLESMLLARHLDLWAHELRASGAGHYTICSSGHEANVVLGRLTRPSDPSLVHYRSAALQIERARQVGGIDPVRDIALSLVASSEEPTSGGRHKVFGRKELGIIPQTSTIASHLPRAVGLAFALEWRKAMKLAESAPANAIVLASFGDASVNHSTALGAFNAASWTAHQNLPLPLLFVCEDNGLGVSVRSPQGWIETRLSALPHVRYFACDGSALDECYRVAEEAVEYARTKRRPVLLHLHCVRLLGHAGSDVDTSYRTQAEIEQARSQDPVLRAAQGLIAGGVLSQLEVLELEADAARRVAAEAERARGRPKLQSRAQVMAHIATTIGPEVAREARRDLRNPSSERLTLAQGINHALAEALERYPETLIFGEDVAKKGGVYGVTKNLFERFGPRRVFNTLLDEQTILGLGLGSATLGLLPIPELQYLAYLHNAEDQLRGEAATFEFFSNGAYQNPMFVRIAGLGYQKGFGGHFHNDNSITVLRDIPGIVVVVPARADDAIELYRTGLALARSAGRVVVSVEPIALYHRRDLIEGDSGWLAEPSSGVAEFLEPRVYRPEAADLCVITYGNGVAMSLKAARRLESEHGIATRIVDLRWLVPLPLDAVLRHAREVKRLLIVDECRSSGSPSEALATALLEAEVKAPCARVTSADSFIPLGDAAELVLVSEGEIVEAALRL